VTLVCFGFHLKQQKLKNDASKSVRGEEIAKVCNKIQKLERFCENKMKYFCMPLLS
jgi:hypothetical protein